VGPEGQKFSKYEEIKVNSDKESCLKYIAEREKWTNMRLTTGIPYPQKTDQFPSLRPQLTKSQRSAIIVTLNPLTNQNIIGMAIKNT
jgi:hypothetical protein